MATSITSSARTLIRRALGTLARTLYPRSCPACGEGARVTPADGLAHFCLPCREVIDLLPPGACLRCGAPADAHLPPGWRPRQCRSCLLRPPPWRRARGYYLYGGPLQDAIVAWKNLPAFHLSEALSDLYLQGVREDGRFTARRFDRIVPIPSHPSALQRRGFNPAGVLAEALYLDARKRGDGGPAFAPGALRVRPDRVPDGTRGKGRACRLRRSADDFRVKSGAIQGARVWLVDDVMTTGATARAATEALLAAGARCVEVGTLARVDREQGPR